MKTQNSTDTGGVNIGRRSFLRYAGIGAASVGVLAVAGCHHDHPVTPSSSIDIGTGDTGLLNYAYALEQLEAAFYTQVILTPYTGISAQEKSYLTAIRDHEVAHRNFFKAALGTSAIVGLTVDFSSINFSSRASVLGTAKAFEDLGVTAYDGAGYLFKSADYLTIAGKIVSVEARHAALIRDLLAPGSFAGSDAVASNGLNNSMSIAQVLPIANTYLKTKVSASNYNYVATN